MDQPVFTDLWVESLTISNISYTTMETFVIEKACRVCVPALLFIYYVLPPSPKKVAVQLCCTWLGCQWTIETLVQKLMEVQYLSIGHLLGAEACSMLATLFTETWIVPLGFRRAKLAIGYYIIYLLQLPHSYYASKKS
jgi:hypothetical protein